MTILTVLLYFVSAGFRSSHPWKFPKKIATKILKIIRVSSEFEENPLRRTSVWELSLSKVQDFQLAIYKFFTRICRLFRKNFEVIPLSVCFWCFHKYRTHRQEDLLVSIFYLPIFLIPCKTQQRPIIIWAFWVTCTYKNLKMECVRFIGKIGRTLVADLPYVIVHHLKSICWSLGLSPNFTSHIEWI